MKKFLFSVLAIVIMMAIQSKNVIAQEQYWQVITATDTVYYPVSVKINLVSEIPTVPTDSLTPEQLQAIKDKFTAGKGYLYSKILSLAPGATDWVTTIPPCSKDFYYNNDSAKTYRCSDSTLEDVFTWILSPNGKQIYTVHHNPNNPSEKLKITFDIIYQTDTEFRIEYKGINSSAGYKYIDVYTKVE